MLLAVDIGNTNIVCAVYAGTEKQTIWRMPTEAHRTVDEYFEDMRLNAAQFCPAIDAAVVASVVPQITDTILAATHKIAGGKPMLIGDDDIDLGIPVRIDAPGQAGADRLVNAVGAKVRYKLPAIIIDFGTATTLDLVAADGGYEGGIIAPGVNLSLDALEMAAAQLPRLQVRPWTSDLPVLGKNTIGAMESGVFWGYVGMIDGLLARLQADCGTVPTVIATGGLAGLFADHIAAISAVDSDLTICGLVEIHTRNSRAAK